MNNSSNRFTIHMAGLAAFGLMTYSLLTILIVVFIGAPPITIEECYLMLDENRFYGLLRLDALTVFVMPLYYILFFGLYLAMKGASNPIVMLSTILVCAGVTLFLATPSVFSYLHLSDQYAQTNIESEKSRLISAGQAILASDMWHGTGARMGGILLQSGALMLSYLMLKDTSFGKLTAYSGILTHGLDLLHIIIGFAVPVVGDLLMMAAAPLYLVWFPSIGNGLLRLAREN
jgi:hypothetical protein